MKLELSIKVDYLKSWDVFSAVRELVANGRDAEVEFNAPLTVEHYNGNTLRIENDGTTLPHEALLLGHSTKMERSDTIGMFGEGLKLAALVLTRAGHAVKIRSGSEVWVPYIERSERFQADVLKFDIAEGREPKNRVRVEVSGISTEDWKELKERFLFLNKKQINSVETPAGTLLLDEKYAGRLFVKGVFVQADPALGFGYDLKDVTLDRDRKLIDSWDLNSKTREIWYGAVANRPDLFQTFFGLLDQQKSDIEGVAWSSQNLPAAAAAYVTDQFVARHGKDAIPVDTFGESKDVGHLGKIGIVTSKSLSSVLSKTLGDLKKLRESLKQEVIKQYSWHELSTQEQTDLEANIALFKDVEPLAIDDIQIVDFRSDLLGLFKDSKILLNKKIMADRNQMLEVMVHETAHRKGGDGDKAHVAQIESIWSRMFARQRMKCVA